VLLRQRSSANEKNSANGRNDTTTQVTCASESRASTRAVVHAPEQMMPVLATLEPVSQYSASKCSISTRILVCHGTSQLHCKDYLSGTLAVREATVSQNLTNYAASSCVGNDMSFCAAACGIAGSFRIRRASPGYWNPSPHIRTNTFAGDFYSGIAFPRTAAEPNRSPTKSLPPSRAGPRTLPLDTAYPHGSRRQRHCGADVCCITHNAFLVPDTASESDILVEVSVWFLCDVL